MLIDSLYILIWTPFLLFLFNATSSIYERCVRGGSRIWKRRGRRDSEARPQYFLANLGDFLNNLSLKGVGVRPPLDPRLCVTKGINLDCELCSERSVLFKRTDKIGQNGFVRCCLKPINIGLSVNRLKVMFQHRIMCASLPLVFRRQLFFCSLLPVYDCPKRKLTEFHLPFHNLIK